MVKRKCPTQIGVTKMKPISRMKIRDVEKEFIRVQKIIKRCPIMEKRNNQLKKRLRIPLNN